MGGKGFGMSVERLFLDTELPNEGSALHMFSIGIVRDDGHEPHAESSEMSVS